jgi:hypothetical protein
VQLLDAFTRNDFPLAKVQATKLVQRMLDFIAAFDASYLSTRKASPPFDFILLVFMNTAWSQPRHTLLVRLLRHYVRVKSVVDGLSGAVFLNDRARSREIELSKKDALPIIQARIDYLAELTASLLYSQGDIRMLCAFLTDVATPEIVGTPETLSHLGRIALAFGDFQLANGFFGAVSALELRAANKAYVSYFGGNFLAAKKEFQDAGALAPANSDLCLKRAGQLTADASDMGPARKLSPEERTQWPLDPKMA